MKEQVEKALAHDRYAVSKLISIFEDSRPEALGQRAEALALLERHPGRRSGTILGVTGAPGCGKSTLIGALALRMAELDPDISVAVLAVDPSSPKSGGALLGDRTRVRFPPDTQRLFFRSQATATELGGLGPGSFHVCRLMHLLFGAVFIETVGIGQSELDVRYLADRLYLVLQPLGGDEIQFMKAGIMEVPDAIILNKCDQGEAAQRSYHALKSSLTLARPFEPEPIPVYQVSGKTGEGIEGLARDMLDAARKPGAAGMAAKEDYFFAKWVRDEWGRMGTEFLSDQVGGPRGFLDRAKSFDAAQADFSSGVRAWLAKPRKGE
ncbi:MAG: protein kinase [Deltaproteobacteria bacterium]|nr:protein kinase [Deltaproteobacteria bacterium]